MFPAQSFHFSGITDTGFQRAQRARDQKAKAQRARMDANPGASSLLPGRLQAQELSAVAFPLLSEGDEEPTLAVVLGLPPALLPPKVKNPRAEMNPIRRIERPNP